MADDSIEDLIKGFDESIAKSEAGLGELEAAEGKDKGKDVGDKPKKKKTKSVRSAAETGGPRRRIAGLLALLLGFIGSLLSIVLAVLLIRAGFAATGAVEKMVEPIDVAIGRMETRIDETDDLVSSGGVDAERVDELQARADGLVDVTTGAREGFDSIEGHPILGRLPIDTSGLGDVLAGFEDSARQIDSTLGTADGASNIEGPVASKLSDELNGMQANVSVVREQIDTTAKSLRRWTRLGSFLGFLGSLWSLWGQVSLARRGWRGFRGRSI